MVGVTDRSSWKVAALLPIRMASVRCANKALRPFGPSSLARLALERINRCEAADSIYFAVHEQELIDLAADLPRIKVLRRTRESAYGEDARTIYDFMEQIEEPIVATLNACCPFLQIATYDRAIREFKSSGVNSIMPVVATQEWYFDEKGAVLSPSDPTLINSKMLPRVYRASHPFTIFDRRRFLEGYRVWSLRPGDPHLFEVSEEEGIDIDTEFQFEVADALYRARAGTVATTAAP